MTKKIQLSSEKQQHLLKSKESVNRLVEEAELSETDRIIEIGAGTGNITEELVKKAGDILAFETDEKFKKYLDKIKGKNLKIIYANALNYDWRGYDKIVSNIPYSLSEPVIIKAIEDKTELIVLIVGENFKEILEKKETKIGIIADLFFDLTPIIEIDKRSFTPQPKVNSWIVKLERKTNLSKTSQILQNIVMKKGKIKNAILYSLVESGKTKKKAREIIEHLNIDKFVLEKPVKSITGKFLRLLNERLEEII
jgi:16S rRNA (adenine1518-N6/adenine1519-N6)-dimethyltransferase